MKRTVPRRLNDEQLSMILTSAANTHENCQAFRLCCPPERERNLRAITDSAPWRDVIANVAYKTLSCSASDRDDATFGTDYYVERVVDIFDGATLRQLEARCG